MTELSEKELQVIEFAVESRMNLENGEQCTIIASTDIIQGIKIAIAKGQVFKDIYSRLILQENPTIVNPYDITIIPDSLIEEAIQEEIKQFLGTNEDTQAKLKALNDYMATINQETLTKISLSDEKELTAEELKIKTEIQQMMIQVGMNVDLIFTNKTAEKRLTEDAVDSVFEKVADHNSVVNLKGLTNEEKA